MEQLADRLKNLTPLQRAVVALKETQARLDALERQRAEPIAIVGMACRFPGGVVDPRSFWRLLCDGVDAIRDTPPDRWDADRFYDPDPTVPGKMCTRWGGYLDAIDKFDNHFFGVSDREAAQIDPQQRLLLELTWEALEDAGLAPSALRGTKTGAFIGISASEYGINLSSDISLTGSHAAAGTSLCLAANRLSFAFGLQGPSLALDTACSSSLVAVHLACQNIRNGECAMALAGGTNLLLTPLGTINLTKAGFCARDGRVRAFDAAAGGYVRSDGAGIVVLKPLSAALKDCDPIYAVIRGSAVNTNGASNGVTAPSRAAQELLLRDAYARAKVSPGQIQYVETQGTGTPLGDTIEALALGSVLSEGRPKESRCAIGAVKTNIGHTEAASGIASLMKAALALKYGQLPGNLHFEKPNPQIPFNRLPLRVLQKLEPWPNGDQPRLAGVSAFGFGGSNAHVVLEESPVPNMGFSRNPEDTPLEGGTMSAEYILPLSARTEAALRDLARRYIEFLGDDPPLWRDICYTAAVRRDHHDCRLAILAQSPAEARKSLAAFLAGDTQFDTFTGRKPYGRNPKIAFVYEQRREAWQEYGTELLQSLPGFSSALESIDYILHRVLDWQLSPAFEDGASRDGLPQAAAASLALQLALTAWWQSAGVTPDVVLGFGTSELAAACAAGILTHEDALRMAAGGELPQNAALQSAKLPFVSSVDGKAHAGTDVGPAHWQACLQGMENREAAAAALEQRGVDFCLSLGGNAADTLRSSVETLAQLYAGGVDLKWSPLLPPDARYVRLPTYPWQRQRLWVEQGKWTARHADETSDAVASLESGKPREHRQRPDLIVPHVEPRSALEKSLAEAWSDVLGIEGIGVHDNFFELGGDSLQATILLNRLRDDLGEALAGHVLFSVQTIAELAEYIGARTTERGAASQPDDAVSNKPAESPPKVGAKFAPLSFAQQRLWLLDRLDPENPAYNIPMALRLSGPIDLALLDRAMTEVVARHETLRTSIQVIDDEPRQVIAAAAPQKLPLIDLTEADLDSTRQRDKENHAQARAQEEARRPLRLNEGPLFRAVLLRLAETEHILVIVMHHVITDDWSMGVLFHELAVLYPALSVGRPSPLPILPTQYADYAAWQRQHLQGETLDRLLGYWRERLAGLATLELPTDRVRPPLVSHEGAVFRGTLPAALVERVKEVGRREGATLYMTLLAGFEVLLHRYSGQDDFAVGSPIAARVRKDTEGLVGFLANTLVMRADLAGNPTFRETLRRVRETALAAFQHQDMPFERLVEELNPPRDTSRHPLFQVLFTLQNAPWPKARLADLSISHVPLDNRTAKFDLWLSLRETEVGLQAEVEYNVALFDATTIERIMGHFQTLLESITADADLPIGSLPILTEPERRQILHEWNDTSKDYHNSACLHELVEAQVARTPQAVAVDFEGTQLTYAELNCAANRLARYLARYDVRKDTAVGVCLERSPELVTSLLAILKAGGAYLPLDPDYPPDRLGFMIADSRPAAIVTTRALAARLPAIESPLIYVEEIADALAAEEEEGNLSARNSLDDVAYVIYTSGSTGRPKGVRNTHRGITNRLLWMQDAYGLTSEDRVLQKTPYSFDVSVWEFFWPLLTGARLVLAQPGGHKDPRYLVCLIDQQQITTLHFVPSMLAVFLEDDEIGRCRSIKRVICSGEALSYELQQRFFARMPAELHNLYGPTEAAVDVTYWQCRPNDARIVPIGRPIANMECYILDRHQNPLPVGCPGELHLGGVGLARDYLNRPELTAEKFIPNPFSSQPGARLYRTGDLSRWLPDGNIEYLGRLDFQVKIRGFRIELGEIETALDAHPAIRQSVVVVRGEAANPRLVGYFVPQDGHSPVAEELREYLRKRLPEFMVPAMLATLDSMPLTASGKVDRKALPVVDRRLPELQVEYVAPRNETETRLVEIWREVLQVERVGIHDNFFSLGGHSLLAAQVASRIARVLRAELPLREMFQSPTIAELAERVESALAGGRRALGPPIVPVSRESALLPSFTQEALWFLDQLERGRATYTIYSPLRIRGRLNLATVERALNEIVSRHEALRTRFPDVDGWPTQVIEPPRPKTLPLVDLSQFPLSEREPRLRREIAEEMDRPIDLQNGPLIRITMYRMADDDHIAMVSAHHIIYDGWSMAVLLGELSALYTAFEAGNPSPLPELPVQYADFAAWQRQWLQGEQLALLREYWVKRLAGLGPLELPLDHPRPGIRSTRGATRYFELLPQTSAALMEFCRREGVTPFETLLAAFQILLMRYSGQEDFAIGAPVANRDRPEIESLIGYFVNVVVLRSELTGDPSFRDLLARVRRTTLEAYDHQAITLDQVVAAVNPPRDMSRHPLFQVMFALQNIELPQLDSFGLSMTPLEDGPSPRSSYFDLTLALWQSGEVFRGELNYSTDLFSSETIDRMAGHYTTLLAEAVAQPDLSLSRLPLLSENERQQLLIGWNQTAADFPRNACVHELFAARAEETPEAIAVVLGDERCTYSELNDRANRLALRLRRRGVGPETRVGICLERSPELIAAVLAVWKAGGAYVPLDAAYNQEAQSRVAYMLDNSEASLVLTTAKLAPSLPCDRARIVLLDDDSELEADKVDPKELSSAAALENLAYILYTSGSTGRPKGVMVTHGNLLNAYQGWAAAYSLDEEVRVHLQMASFGFDVFAGDLLRALCSGGTLVICRKESLFQPAELVRLMRDENVDAAEFVPVVLRNLVQHLEETGQELDFMKLVVVGSDAWYAGDHRRARAILPPAARLVNSYGLTETTIDSSYYEGDTDELPEGAVMPIGRPFANVRFYVLDGRMQPAPIGVAGELYIGGLGVSRGYIDPALDAARFVPDPFSLAGGAKLCRTGDRARRRTDGQTEFLGRADNQVKIRGFRVEPGEVEQVLAEHPLVAHAAVVDRERSPGDVRLVAFFVTVADAVVDDSELRTFLAARLPNYMVPSAFVALTSLPTTTNGKINRNSLPEPDWSELAASHDFVEPRTSAEEQLAAIWSDVLNVERVGATDNFFDLGGNSLLALRLISRVRSAFTVELPLVSLFKTPTLEGLAAEIAAIRAARGASSLPPIVARPVTGPVEASIIAEGFYSLQQLMPDSPALNMPTALRLSGKLDVSALMMAIDEMVRRHAILRTTFKVADDGGLMQIVAPEMPMRIPVEDFSATPETSRTEIVRRLGEEQALARFDLEKGPLIRMRLLRFSETEHVVLATTHHVASDAWSMEIVARELAALYDAFHSRQPSPLPPLQAQYTDYSVWQRGYLQGDVVQNLLNYWRKKLDGLQPIKLPLDRPRKTGASANQRVHNFRVPRRLRDRLVRLCQREQVTLYMLTLAVYKMLLHRYSGTSDVAVGAPIAGRRHPETHGMIGLFMNMLVMRTDLSGKPGFRELLRRVRETVLEALDHQDLPFGHLIADLAPGERSANEVPLVQVLFNYLQRGDATDIQRRHDLKIRFENTDLLTAGTGEFDLVLGISDDTRELQCALSYDANRFDNQTIERMAEDMLAMLESVAGDLEQEIDGAEIDPLRAPGRLSRLPLIRPIPRGGPLRASFAQERYWYLQQLAGQAPNLNMHIAVSLKGKLDVAAMRTAMNLVANRHESLRTSFVERAGELFQVIVPEVRVQLPVEDIEHLPSEQRIPRARELSRTQATEPFDLATAELFRARLVRLGDAEHVLLLTMHHIIGDAWTVEIIAREVIASYLSNRVGLTASLPDLPVQYADYAAWQREYLQGAVLDSLLNYWRGKLGSMATLELPLDRPRDPAAPRVQRMESFHVPPGLKKKLGRLCREEGTTPFMLFLAAFQTLLHDRSGSDDITIVAPVTERYIEETQSMVGLFVNTIAFRTDLGGDPTFRELLSRVRLTVYEALDHRELPFEWLITELRADRELTRRQLDRVRFRFHERTAADDALPLWELTAEILPDASDVAPEIFDLVLTVIDGPQGFQGHWSYDGALFDEHTIRSLTADLQSLLENVSAKPDRPLPQLFGRDAPHAPARAAAPQVGGERSPHSESRSLVPLRPGGSERPLFLIHGLGGHIAALLPLARSMAGGRPVYGLQALGLDPEQMPQDRIETMATSYLEEIRSVQPEGPYLLVGWSMGGVIALEAARQLLAAGQETALVAMLDTPLSLKDIPQQELDEQSVLHRIAPQLNVPVAELQGLPLDRQWERIAELAEKAEGIGIAEIRRLAAACKVHLLALSRYEIRPYMGEAVLFSADGANKRRARASINGRGREKQWKSLFPKLHIVASPGDHFSMLREPYVRVLAERLDRFLQACDGDIELTTESVSQNKTPMELSSNGKNGADTHVHPTETRAAR
jgi:amino acid adenylation domain-containing protein